MNRALLLAAVSLSVPLTGRFCRPARAEEFPAPVSAAAASPGFEENEIGALCRQLGDADFLLREQATRQLLAGGPGVIDQVAAAAETDGLEVVIRSLAILKELYQRPEEPTKAAARTALERLAASRHRSAARRAAAILSPPEAYNPAAQRLLLRANVPRGAMDVRVIQAGNFGGANGGGIRVRTVNNNGNVTINAEENGRKVLITHRHEEQIVVVVTAPPAAGEPEGKTTEFRAKDVAELKEKHPEAHRLYEQYGGGAGRVLGGGFGLPK
jgi:hypothetical protein